MCIPVNGLAQGNLHRVHVTSVSKTSGDFLTVAYNVMEDGCVARHDLGFVSIR
jgi:hypothetical protein